MYSFGIINSIKMLIAYFLLIIFLPSLILNSRFKKEDISKRFIIYIVFGNIYISSIVFTLAYLNIFNRAIFIISTIILSIFLYIFLDKKRFRKNLNTSKKILKELILGKYGFKLFLTRAFDRIKKYIKDLYRELFDGRKIEWLIFLAIIFYNLYQYGINNIEYITYMAPDEEVHLYWIQSLLKGDIFPDGVYPHIFHNVVGGIIRFFNLNPMIAMRYLGASFIILIMTSLYLGLKKIFKSKYAALLGFMLYSTINIFFEQVTYRFQFTIPQEYGMIMLMPMAIFLFDYIKDRKTSDLIFFGLALSLGIGIHFYTGIIAVVLAIAIGIVYLYRIIKDRIFLKLILCGLLSLALAMAPLALGLGLGYPLEQSFEWASDVIKGDVYSKTSDGILKDKKDNIKYKEEIEAGEVKLEEIGDLTLEKFLIGARSDIEKYLLLDIKVLYGFLFIILVSLIYNISSIFYRKVDRKNKYQIAFNLNVLIILILILFKSMRLPTIMEPKRLAIYFAYFSSFILGMPLEILNSLLERTRLKKSIALVSLGTIILGLVLTLHYKMLRPLPPFYYFQTTGTMISNIEIMKEYEDYTWTAISPVNNISGVINNGFHYELDKFILEQENWNSKKEIKLPTEYIFLYVEKMPIIKYGFSFHREDYKLKNRPKISKEDALKDLTVPSVENYHYTRERDILMAKAYCWAEEYKKYFPKEMDVFYEDPELIIYKIKQNTRALNNLSIDYKINSR